MTFNKRIIFRRTLLVIQILMLIPIGWFIYHVVMPRGFASKVTEVLPIRLSTGDFQVLYRSAENPRGILVVASGDGGWSNQWEEPMAVHASEAGYVVAGWDCRRFADTRQFDHPQLVEAFKAAVDAVRKKAGLPPDCPVWYTGWSTGAEWGVAAASSPEREKHLVGILAAAPGDRSRYGISASDLLGLDPQGEGSFALKDHAAGLAGLRIVQFSAGLDPLDGAEWLRSLGTETPHKIVSIPDVPHDMGGAGPRFLSDFDMAIQWMADH